MNQDETEGLAQAIEYHDQLCTNEKNPMLSDIGHTYACVARFYAADRLRNIEVNLHNLSVRKAQENNAWHNTMDELDRTLEEAKRYRETLVKLSTDCTDATPWCDDRTHTNDDHYMGHVSERKRIIEEALKATEPKTEE